MIQMTEITLSVGEKTCKHFNIMLLRPLLNYYTKLRIK